METEKISIIIPAFNPGPILENALKSIFLQDYNNIELIIIDGGSNDGTIELLKKYSKHIHYWVSESDDGIYDAMNKGITAATGTWLLFLGADDELCQGIISAIFNLADFTDIDFIYGKVNIKNKRKLLGQQTDFEKLIVMNIPHQAIFYRKSIFEKFKGYNQRYKILADYDLNLKIFEDNSLKKKFINKTIAFFCKNGISRRTIDHNFFTEKKDYFINQYKFLRTNKKIAKYYFFSGVALVLKKNIREGSSNILHAIIFSQNRFNFFLLTISFVLSLFGFGKKYKYV